MIKWFINAVMLILAAKNLMIYGDFVFSEIESYIMILGFMSFLFLFAWDENK